jgi:hypothetical protein
MWVQALGRIRQQPGLVGVALQLLGHPGDGHQLAGVPEQAREHHQGAQLQLVAPDSRASSWICRKQSVIASRLGLGRRSRPP